MADSQLSAEPDQEVGSRLNQGTDTQMQEEDDPASCEEEKDEGEEFEPEEDEESDDGSDGEATEASADDEALDADFESPRRRASTRGAPSKSKPCAKQMKEVQPINETETSKSKSPPRRSSSRGKSPSSCAAVKRSPEAASTIEKSVGSKRQKKEEADEEDIPGNGATPSSDASAPGGTQAPRLARNPKMVFEYLKRTNRPFGVPDLGRAIKDLNKGQITSSLSELVEKGLATAKDKVYYVSQRVFGDISNAGLESKRETYKALAESEKQALEQVAALDREIDALRQEPEDQEFEAKISEVSARVEAKSQALSQQKENNPGSSNSSKSSEQPRATQKSTTRDVDDLRSEFKFYKAAWRSRKVVVEDVVADILESLGKKAKKRDLLEDLGIEDDEMHKVCLKQI